MTTTPVSGASAAAQAAQAAKTADAKDKGAATNAVSGDFDTFLKLLTTQLRNQDPEDPVDSTQYVTQLATFSSVEQQVQMNQKLDGLVEAMSGGASSGLSRWIGVDVQSDGFAMFDGKTPVDVALEPPRGAKQAVMTVTGADGRAVERVKIDPEATSVSWEGKGAEAGAYGFSVAYTAGGKELGDVRGRVWSPVREARLENGAQILVLEGGHRAPAKDVTAVRGTG